MSKIPYEITTVTDPRKSPKGKLPFIIDGNRVIHDSSLVIDYLKQTYGDTLDAHLCPKRKANALALQCLIEEHLYWTMLYSRWIDPAGWLVLKETFFNGMPTLLKFFIPKLIRKQQKKACFRQGMGRHSREAIYTFGKNDLTALSCALDSQRYFMGDTFSSIDAIAHAFLSNILYVPIDSPLKRHLQSLSNLVAFCDRVKQRLYP